MSCFPFWILIFSIVAETSQPCAKEASVCWWLTDCKPGYDGREVPGRELRLRNYNPEDEELKKRKVPQAKPASVEEKVKDQLEAAKPEPIIEEVVCAWILLPPIKCSFLHPISLAVLN
uniref:Uncharacterized protein n=1 Tax=Crocodylus porosus TaxID=8502 RepID=A0A7M4E460_CROPO